MDQLDLAIHATAHGYGLPELARKLGKNEQVLRNKLNPHGESHILGLHEFVAIMDITGDLAALETLAAMFGYTLIRKAETRVGDLMAAVLSTDVEHGDVIRAIQEALADGRLSPRDRQGIVKEIREARRALDDMESLVVIEEGVA